MLKIKIGDTFAETSGVEIPVTLRSPLFLDNGRVPGSFVFNFQIPHTDAMKAETGYIHRPARYGSKPQKKPFYLEFGPLKFIGECSIINADESYIEINAPIDTGSLASLLKEIKMSDIALGGVRQSPSNSLTINFNLDCQHNNGTATFRLYVNGILSFSAALGDGLNSLSTVLDINPSDSITWDFLLESQASGVPDEYSIDWSLLSGSTISISFDSVIQLLASTSRSIFINTIDTVEFSLIQNAFFDSITTNLNGIMNTGGTEVIWINEAFVESLTALYPDSDFTLFPLQNEKLLDNLEDDVYAIDHKSIKEIYSKYFPVLNYFKSDGFPSLMSGIINDESFSAYNLFCPFPYLAYFVKQMSIHLQLNVENNVFESDDLKQLVIYNSYAENNFINNDLIQIIPGFDLSKHVPNEKLSNFLNEVLKLLAIAVDYKSYSRTIRFSNLNDVVSDTSFQDFPGIITTKPTLKHLPYNGYKLSQSRGNDAFASDYFKTIEGLTLKGSVTFWNQLPGSGNEINDCYYVTFWKEYYIWNYDKELAILNWIFHSKEFRHEITEVNDDETGDTLELSSEWGACMIEHNPGIDVQLCAPANRGWLIPKVQEPGIFEGLPPTFTADFSKFILFYRGMQQDSQGNTYPLGTNDVYDYSGAKIDGADLSLRWDGEYGLWEKRHKRWIEWLVGCPGVFSLKTYLSPLQISQLDWFRWYRIFGHDFLVKEIRFNIYENSISESELDLMRR